MSHVGPELIAFHFGELEGAARDRVEAHLTECLPCLREYLQLKRSVEAPQDAPSAASRARLFAAVDEELRVRWSWWERPLAFGVAAAVVLACVSLTGAVSHRPGAPPLSAASRTR